MAVMYCCMEHTGASSTRDVINCHGMHLEQDADHSPVASARRERGRTVAVRIRTNDCLVIEEQGCSLGVAPVGGEHQGRPHRRVHGARPRAGLQEPLADTQAAVVRSKVQGRGALGPQRQGLPGRVARRGGELPAGGDPRAVQIVLEVRSSVSSADSYVHIGRRSHKDLARLRKIPPGRVQERRSAVALRGVQRRRRADEEACPARQAIERGDRPSALSMAAMSAWCSRSIRATPT